MTSGSIIPFAFDKTLYPDCMITNVHYEATGTNRNITINFEKEIAADAVRELQDAFKRQPVDGAKFKSNAAVPTRVKIEMTRECNYWKVLAKLQNVKDHSTHLLKDSPYMDMIFHFREIDKATRSGYTPAKDEEYSVPKPEQFDQSTRSELQQQRQQQQQQQRQQQQEQQRLR